MLNYKIEGSGDTLVLIHGFGISFIIWENLLPKLSENHKVIMVELPGIGSSEYQINDDVNYYKNAAIELQNLLDTLGVSKFSAIAYSLGAKVLCEYALSNKQSVDKAILLHPVSFGRSKEILLKSLQIINKLFPVVVDFIISGFSLYILIFKLGFNYKYTKKIKVWYNVITTNDIRVLKKSIFDLLHFRKLNYDQVFENALVVWGKHDLLVSRFKTIDKICIINGGHSGPVSHAESVIVAIDEFLKN